MSKIITLKGMVIEGNPLVASSGMICSVGKDSCYSVFAKMAKGDGLTYAEKHNEVIDKLESRINQLIEGLLEVKELAYDIGESCIAKDIIKILGDDDDEAVTMYITDNTGKNFFEITCSVADKDKKEKEIRSKLLEILLKPQNCNNLNTHTARVEIKIKKT